MTEEGHVGHRVGVAEPLVELDAVDDDQVGRRRSVGEEVDVVQVQVAVAVARHAPVGPSLDQRPERGQGRFGQVPQPLEDGPAERRAHLGGRLVEVLAGVAGHHLEAAEGRDRRPGLGPGVERGDPAGQGLQRLDADLPAAEPLPERGLVGQALHLHRPLDDLALPSIRTPGLIAR